LELYSALFFTELSHLTKWWHKSQHLRDF